MSKINFCYYCVSSIILLSCCSIHAEDNAQAVNPVIKKALESAIKESDVHGASKDDFAKLLKLNGELVIMQFQRDSIIKRLQEHLTTISEGINQVEKTKLTESQTLTQIEVKVHLQNDIDKLSKLSDQINWVKEK